MVMWEDPWFLTQGPSLGARCQRASLTTDASLAGWGVTSWSPSPGSVAGTPAFVAHTLPGNVGSLSGSEALPAAFRGLSRAGTHRQHIGGRSPTWNIRKGLRSRRLYKLARLILLRAQGKLLSVRAMYIPGSQNVEAEILSRQGPRPGEWRLHTDVVELLWEKFVRAQVDLFVTTENTHCHLWFSLVYPAPPGLDGMVQVRLRLPLYVFSPIALLPGVLERVRQGRGPASARRPVLAGPSIWFSDLVSLLDSSPLEIPIRRDLLSQVGGVFVHPRPELWKLWAWPLRGPNS